MPKPNQLSVFAFAAISIDTVKPSIVINSPVLFLSINFTPQMSLNVALSVLPRQQLLRHSGTMFLFHIASLKAEALHRFNTIAQLLFTTVPFVLLIHLAQQLLDRATDSFFVFVHLLSTQDLYFVNIMKLAITLLSHIPRGSILLLDVSLSVPLTSKFILLMLTFSPLLSRVAFHKLNFVGKSSINHQYQTRLICVEYFISRTVLASSVTTSITTANKSSDNTKP